MQTFKYIFKNIKFRNKRFLYKFRVFGKIFLPLIPQKIILIIKQLEVIVRCHLFNFYFEEEERVLIDILKDQPTGVAIDCGANFGQYSYPLAKLANCSKVISIEPQPIIADMFKKMNKKMNINKINLVPFLVADFIGTSYLQTPNRNGYSATQETFMSKSKTSSVQKEIQVFTLDHILKKFINLEDVTVVKIDVEGAEMKVLNGAKELFSQAQPIVLIELVDTYLSKFSSSIGDVISWFENLDYSTFVLNENGNLIKYFLLDDSRPQSDNYFFLPNKMKLRIYT